MRERVADQLPEPSTTVEYDDGSGTGVDGAGDGHGRRAQAGADQEQARPRHVLTRLEIVEQQQDVGHGVERGRPQSQRHRDHAPALPCSVPRGERIIRRHDHGVTRDRIQPTHRRHAPAPIDAAQEDRRRMRPGPARHAHERRHRASRRATQRQLQHRRDRIFACRNQLGRHETAFARDQ